MGRSTHTTDSSGNKSKHSSSHHHHHKKKKSSSSKRSRSRSRSSPPPPVSVDRLLRYAALGKTRKLRALLDDGSSSRGGGNVASLLNATALDASGAGALHQAARHGQVEVVQMLLRRAADPRLSDAAGNTPGHLAAMHGHWLVLTELVKAADIDLDKANAAGFTIRQIVQQQQQQAGGPHPDSPARPNSSGSVRSRGTHSPVSSTDTDRAAAVAAAAAAGAAAAKSGYGLSGAAAAAVEDEDDWMDKLAYEMSYDDGGGGGGWRGAWAAAAAAEPRHGPHSRSRTPQAAAAGRKRSASAAAASGGDYGDDDDGDDLWADRLWQDMQQHQRQAAAARAAAAAAAAAGVSSSSRLFGAGPSRQEAAQERERKAAAAAAESARILREERAKDADWRAAMMRQVEEASLPLRRSTYEERWQQFEAWPAGKPIAYADIPWPVPTPGSQAAAVRNKQQQALQLDPKQLQTLVLAGAKSAADIKLAFRRELMRWHPDKFTARYGGRLLPADKEAIDAGVHAVAQQLTALKQQ